MSNLPSGAENDPNAPYNETENYCNVCDEPIGINSSYCSQSCWDVDNR